MKHSEKVKAIKFIRPDAEFILNDDELTWLDKTQIEPTEAEIKTGLIAYEAALQAEAKTKTTAKAALLDRLGITAEEATLLLS
jgi:hypothetical protein